MLFHEIIKSSAVWKGGLWSARHFAHLLALSGDQGARVLFREFGEQIIEVEMPDDGVLVDIDTKAALEMVLSRCGGSGAARAVEKTH